MRSLREARRIRLFLGLVSLSLLLWGCSLRPKPDATGDWIAAWGSAQLAPAPPTATAPALRDVSLRQVLRVSAAGTALRVQVSNLFGQEPLLLSAASVALLQTGSPQQPTLQADSLRPLRFEGRRNLTLAPGAEVWSDAVELAVPRLAELAVQMHLLNAPAPATAHPGSRISSWVVAGQQVDTAVWADAKPRDGWWHLAAADVRTAQAQPVLVAVGDSITDGYGVPPGSYQRWTDVLASRLADTGKPASVINTGIGGGRLLRDGLGPNLLSRFERDVLARSGVSHAVVLIAINDLGSSHRERATTPESRAALLAELKAGFSTLALRAHERGVCLLVATVMPYRGSGYYRPQAENEADRLALNDWIRSAGQFDAVLDFDALARDPARPGYLRAELDNDGLHPSMAGYRAMAEAFPLGLLERRCGARMESGRERNDRNLFLIMK